MYKKILVLLDGSELAECVLPHVKIFIKECKVKNMLFLRVVQSTTMTLIDTENVMEDFKEIGELDENNKSNAARYLKDIAKKFKNETTRLHTEVILGDVPSTIIDYVENNKVDLIIMATHGRSGVGRWVRGSVADKVLHASAVPVLLVRAPGTNGAI